VPFYPVRLPPAGAEKKPVNSASEPENAPISWFWRGFRPAVKCSLTLFGQTLFTIVAKAGVRFFLFEAIVSVNRACLIEGEADSGSRLIQQKRSSSGCFFMPIVCG
jgi:hypothetical protein